jgi:hypothetical protein
MDFFIISCMMHTASTSQLQKALASQMGMLGFHNTYRVHWAADLEHWNPNEKVSRSHSSLKIALNKTDDQNC